MKSWYEDYQDLRRNMIRQNSNRVHFYEVDKNLIKSNKDTYHRKEVSLDIEVGNE